VCQKHLSEQNYVLIMMVRHVGNLFVDENVDNVCQKHLSEQNYILSNEKYNSDMRNYFVVMESNTQMCVLNNVGT